MLISVSFELLNYSRIARFQSMVRLNVFATNPKTNIFKNVAYVFLQYGVKFVPTTTSHSHWGQQPIAQQCFPLSVTLPTSFLEASKNASIWFQHFEIASKPIPDLPC